MNISIVWYNPRGEDRVHRCVVGVTAENYKEKVLDAVEQFLSYTPVAVLNGEQSMTIKVKFNEAR